MHIHKQSCMQACRSPQQAVRFHKYFPSPVDGAFNLGELYLIGPGTYLWVCDIAVEEWISNRT